jgi:hypothetical protein
MPPSTPPGWPAVDAGGAGGSGLISEGASIGAALGLVDGRAVATCRGAAVAFGAGGGGGGGGGGGVAAGATTNAIIAGTSGMLSVAYSNGTTITAVMSSVCPTTEANVAPLELLR